jgi:pyruvate carboxylase
VIGFLSGELGDPPGGWPEPFRTKALEGRSPKTGVSELDDEDRKGLAGARRATLNRLLFPGPTQEYEQSRADHSDLSVLPTRSFFYGLDTDSDTEVRIEEGKTLIFGVEAISEADERGLRTVMCTINGQLRPITVRDRSVESDVKAAEKADPSDKSHVAVPFAGVVTPSVAEGDTVEAGQAVASIEAMKMEASITAAIAGTVQRLVIERTRQAEGGDLVCVIG